MKPEKKRRTPQVGVRLPEELSQRLEKACSQTRIDTSTVVRACIEAFCDEVEDKGGVWLPLRIVPKKSGMSEEQTPARPSAQAGGRSMRGYPPSDESPGVALVAEEGLSYSSKKGSKR